MSTQLDLPGMGGKLTLEQRREIFRKHAPVFYETFYRVLTHPTGSKAELVITGKDGVYSASVKPIKETK